MFVKPTITSNTGSLISPLVVPSFFPPTAIPGINLWLSARFPQTITEVSGEVSQWDDMSGTGNHATQSSASLRYVYDTDAAGGHLVGTGPATIGNVTNEFMDLSNPALGKTVFFVGDVDKTINADPRGHISCIIASDGAPQNEYIFMANRQGTTFSYGCSLDGSGGTGGQGSWYVDGAFIAQGGNIGNASDIPAGVGVHSFVYDSIIPTSPYAKIGAINTVEDIGFLGKIREFIVYDRVLSDAERQQVEAYLINAFGI